MRRNGLRKAFVANSTLRARKRPPLVCRSIPARERETRSTDVPSKTRTERRWIARWSPQQSSAGSKDTPTAALDPETSVIGRRVDLGTHGIGEASVSSRGTLADSARLEEHDVTPRRLLRREQGGPQPRKTSAHDREIGFLVLRNRRRRLRPLRTIEPVAGGARMFECGEVRVDDVIPCARIAL